MPKEKAWGSSGSTSTRLLGSPRGCRRTWRKDREERKIWMHAALDPARQGGVDRARANSTATISIDGHWPISIRPCPGPGQASAPTLLPPAHPYSFSRIQAREEAASREDPGLATAYVGVLFAGPDPLNGTLERSPKVANPGPLEWGGAQGGDGGHGGPVPELSYTDSLERDDICHKRERRPIFPPSLPQPAASCAGETGDGRGIPYPAHFRL